MLSLNARGASSPALPEGLSEPPPSQSGNPRALRGPLAPERDDDSLAGGKVRGERSGSSRSLHSLREPGPEEDWESRHVRRSRAASSLRRLLPGPALPSLSRPRSRPPLPLRAASASHLALALSAVLVPLLSPRDFSSVSSAAAAISGRAPGLRRHRVSKDLLHWLRGTSRSLKRHRPIG